MAKLMHTPIADMSTDAGFKRWRWQIFGITWLTYAGFYFSRQAFSVAKLGILDDPSVNGFLTRSMLGNLDAMYLAAYAVGQFFWGTLADRIGPRRVVLGGLFMSAVAAIVMGTGATLLIFAAFMLVQGLAQSTGWSSLCKNMGNFFTSRERGRVLGFWSTNYAFGGLLAGPFVGWWAYAVFSSWRVTFFAGAAVVAIVFVLFLIFQRDRPRDVGLPDIDEDEAEGPEGEKAQSDEPSLSTVQALREVLSNKMVLTLGASYFLLKPARYAILLWGPVIVSQRLPEISKVGAAVVPVAFGVAGLLAPIVIGFVSDKLFAAKRVPPCVLSLVGLMIVMAVFAPLTRAGSVWLMVVLLGLIGLTAYAADSMISCVSAIDFGTRKGAGTAAGFTNGCGSVGAILGGLLPGYFTGNTLFYGFAGAALLAALLLAPHWNRRPASD